EVGFDLEEPVTITFGDEPLGDALRTLIRGSGVWGVFAERQNGILCITTDKASQQRIKAHLPEWMQAFFGRGLVASLDDDHQVAKIAVGDPLTDELLARFATLPHLRELDISGTAKLTAEGLGHLADLTGLEKLSLSGLGDKGGRTFGDTTLKQVVQLKSL